jgi:hypothetical protein
MHSIHYFGAPSQRQDAPCIFRSPDFIWANASNRSALGFLLQVIATTWAGNELAECDDLNFAPDRAEQKRLAPRRCLLKEISLKGTRLDPAGVFGTVPLRVEFYR